MASAILLLTYTSIWELSVFYLHVAFVYACVGAYEHVNVAVCMCPCRYMFMCGGQRSTL